jgi:hypothetical protein
MVGKQLEVAGRGDGFSVQAIIDAGRTNLFATKKIFLNFGRDKIGCAIFVGACSHLNRSEFGWCAGQKDPLKHSSSIVGKSNNLVLTIPYPL